MWEYPTCGTPGANLHPDSQLVLGSEPSGKRGNDMESTRPRMIAVAVIVCLFAVGMAAFLNYFKYRATVDRIVKARLAVIGLSIENSIQASLALGLSFSDLGMLQSLIDRETATHELIHGIDIFDTDGKPLYSTDRMRAGRSVSQAWLNAARRSSGANWFVQEGNESAVGIAIKNNFGLTVGHLALRYSHDKMDGAAREVGQHLAMMALLIFVGAAAIASVALVLVMRSVERDMRQVESILSNAESPRNAATLGRGLFGPALVRFFENVRTAELQIAALRARLSRGAPS